MARYLYGAVLTGPAVASNNRGENSGNMAMLQHVFWGGHDHTTVSSEAIRFAIRYRAQLEDEAQVNRLFDNEGGKWAYRVKDVYNPEKYADDDIFGFMNAQAAKQNGTDGDADAETAGKRKKAKGTIDKRRAPLAVARAGLTRAVSRRAVFRQPRKGKGQHQPVFRRGAHHEVPVRFRALPG